MVIWHMNLRCDSQNYLFQVEILNKISNDSMPLHVVEKEDTVYRWEGWESQTFRGKWLQIWDANPRYDSSLSRCFSVWGWAGQGVCTSEKCHRNGFGNKCKGVIEKKITFPYRQME